MLEVIAQLCGGIGLFLIGMILMTDSLKDMAGETLRLWLTDSRNAVEITMFWYWSDLDCPVFYSDDAGDYRFCRSWSVEFLPGDWGDYGAKSENDQYRLDGGLLGVKFVYHHFCLTSDCCRCVAQIVNTWAFGLIRVLRLQVWPNFLWNSAITACDVRSCSTSGFVHFSL